MRWLRAACLSLVLLFLPAHAWEPGVVVDVNFSCDDEVMMVGIADMATGGFEEEWGELTGLALSQGVCAWHYPVQASVMILDLVKKYPKDKSSVWKVTPGHPLVRFVWLTDSIVEPKGEEAKADRPSVLPPSPAQLGI